MDKLEGNLTREQRAQVAKDVLARFTRKGSKFNVDTGDYIFSSRYLGWSDGQLKSSLLAEDCTVCALGSMFLSSVDLFNRCEIKKFSEDSIYLVQDRVEEDWGCRQAGLIECAFEGYDVRNVIRDLEALHHAVMFYEERSILEPRLRLAAICRNVIKNNGEFIPMPIRLSPKPGLT